MLLPNAKTAYVPDEKVSGYLLSDTHPVGKTKSKLLKQLGFTEADRPRLTAGLLAIARTQNVHEETITRYGVKFAVDGVLRTPSGHEIKMRTIWIAETNEPGPRFVTAYPAP